MSQQYGPAGQGGPGPQDGQPLPRPGQDGWGPGPRGYPPGQFRPPGRPRRTPWSAAGETTLMGAKAFADQLVDVELNNLQHVVIGKEHPVKCRSAALKACYATNYSAVVPIKGKKPVVFAGFIQAFEDKNGMTTATDAVLQKEIYQAHKQEVLDMNVTLVSSI